MHISRFANLRGFCQNIDCVLSLFVIVSAQEGSILIPFLRKLLNLKLIVPSPSLIQIGTFLASGHFEEIKPKIDSHSPAYKSTIIVVDDREGGNHDS